MIHSKKGFTLFELMIVLALIGVFFGITMSMNKDARTYQLSAERLANSIYDIVRTARSNMIIGRGVFSGSTMVVATERTIYLTSTGLISTYRNTTATGTETTLVERYFDNDPLYKIIDIAVSSGGIIGGVVPTWDNTGSTISSIAITIASNADLTITGTGTNLQILSKPIRTLRITASYLTFEKSVLIDRITGTIELMQGRGGGGN
jgi:prepilin-type N-terminal cleavage/methylation domain-containing protein